MDLYFFDTIKKAKRECQHEFFMEVFTIAVWEISKQRDDLIFRDTPPSFHSWKVNFISSVKQQLYRLNQDTVSTIV
jgi:hypothetical protein